MDIQIFDKPLSLTIYGFSGVATNKDHVSKAMQLMDKMWGVVKGNNLENKGKNIWVYEQGDMVFTGVELGDAPGPSTTLEEKIVTLPKYAYYKHIGSYNLIRQSYINMTGEIKLMGLNACLPYIEIYGHWDNDESRLETELLMCIK
jgi:hypothetical protein